jgi:hypothetical protein
MLQTHKIKAGRKPGFCIVRPAGRVHLEVKVLYEPAGGIVSRTTRVSVVRWNPEEAAGKTLA